ncbi:MAG: hypothetical protein AB8B85_12500 [Paracoccaceae bacterium]
MLGVCDGAREDKSGRSAFGMALGPLARHASLLDGQSRLNLAAAMLRHIAGTQWSTRRYMNMDPLHAAKNDQTGPAVA